MKRVYENDDIRVFWDSEKCIHVGNCTRGAPDVFNPERRPWVDVNAGEAEEIKRVVDTCPTGALSYERPQFPTAKIIVLADGPFKVEGDCLVVRENNEVVDTGRVFALCRCGASKNMPFCDGQHLEIGFRDTEVTGESDEQPPKVSS